jgi:hypothetical protein
MTDATPPSRPDLRLVPDLDAPDPLKGTPQEQAEARSVAFPQVVQALAVLGLTPRYVQAIGIREDGIWVHSVIPGKTGGGVLVSSNDNLARPNYVEYLPVTELPEEDA